MEPTHDKTIIRTVHDRNNPYVVIDSRVFANAALTWKAKGLLGYLLTKPDDWRVYLSEIVKHATDGREATRSALEELEKAGYIVRRRRRTDEGKFLGFELVVYEVPVPEAERTNPDDRRWIKNRTGEPVSGFPKSDNPKTEKPKTENPTLPSNDSTQYPNTKYGQTEEEDGADAPPPSQPSGSTSSQQSQIDPEQTVAFSGPYDRLLEAILKAEARAAGRRGPLGFESMPQKAAFRSAAQAIVDRRGIDELHEAINWALKNGRTSRGRIIATLESWATNLDTPKPQGSGKRQQTINVMNADQYRAWLKDNPVPEPVAIATTDEPVPF